MNLERKVNGRNPLALGSRPAINSKCVRSMKVCARNPTAVNTSKSIVREAALFIISVC